MRRPVPIALVVVAALSLALSASVTVATAQSLGDVAARTNKERKGKGGKVYTNDDLSAEHASSPVPPAAASTTSEPAASPAATMDPAQRWRRDAITGLQAKVDGLQSRLDALMADRDPVNVMDPNRLQTLEAEKVKVRAELEAAKDELAKARQALQDLEEAARKAGVPPGWLDER